MEGVTDFPMRALMTESRAFSFCVTEFLRVTQHVPPQKTFREFIQELDHDSKTDSGTPVVLQLLGGDAQCVAETAAQGIRLGACGIDINFGCPAPTVNRNDGGATLLKYPSRIREIVQAVRKMVPLEFPVSAKLRLGWENEEDILINAEMAASGGASWIAIHARTRMQGYRPPVAWRWIKEVRARFPEIPVISNGDIWTLEDFERCRDISQSEQIMLGRGALADPFLPIQVAKQLGLLTDHSKTPELPLQIGPSLEEWRPWLERFIAVSLPHTRHSSYLVKRIKQWIQFARMRQEIPWFEQLKTLQTLSEVQMFLAHTPPMKDLESTV